MAKKTLKKKIGAKKASPAASSARDIWLAGLGALSLAQQESGKVLEQGSKLFDKLVKEGDRFENKTRKAATGAVGDIKGGVETRFESVRKQAAENWDKLENVFEQRVARALGRLGVPTAEDIQDLIGRVQELSEKVKAAAIDAVTKDTTAEKAKKTVRKTKSKATKTAKTRARRTASAASKRAKKVAKEVKAKAA